MRGLEGVEGEQCVAEILYYPKCTKVGGKSLQKCNGLAVSGRVFEVGTRFATKTASWFEFSRPEQIFFMNRRLR